MGGDRAETVRRMYELSRSSWRDGEAGPITAYAGFADEIEYAPVPNYPEYRHVRGLDEMRTWIGRMAADWGGVDIELTSVEEYDDAVITRVMMRAEGTVNRPPLEGRLFSVFTFRGDQVVRIEDFLSAAEARRAAEAAG